MTKPFILRLILAVLLTVSATAQQSAESPFRAGTQAYTYNHFTIYEAIEKTAEAGGTVVEFYLGQRLNAADPAKIGPDLSEEQGTALQAHLKNNRVTAESCFVTIPKDEAKAHELFALTTESVESIEKMVKDFVVHVVIHEHMMRPNNESYKADKTLSTGVSDIDGIFQEFRQQKLPAAS